MQEEVYGKPIIVADREMVEEKADGILFEAQVSDVAFLVVGDPFGYLFHHLAPAILHFFVDCLTFKMDRYRWFPFSRKYRITGTFKYI